MIVVTMIASVVSDVIGMTVGIAVTIVIATMTDVIEVMTVIATMTDEIDVSETVIVSDEIDESEIHQAEITTMTTSNHKATAMVAVAIQWQWNLNNNNNNNNNNDKMNIQNYHEFEHMLNHCQSKRCWLNARRTKRHKASLCSSAKLIASDLHWNNDNKRSTQYVNDEKRSARHVCSSYKM
jgi:hypothetical protein